MTRALLRRPAVVEPPVEHAEVDAQLLVTEVRSGGAETRAHLEDLVRGDAEARAATTAEMQRILSDQSAAVDDANEVLGRILAGLVADMVGLRQDVAGLRADVARLRDDLTGAAAVTGAERAARR